MGEFNRTIQGDENANVSRSFSSSKTVIKKGCGSPIILRSKESELHLNRDEWAALVEVKDEVDCLFKKFLVYHPVPPKEVNAGQSIGSLHSQQLPMMNSAAASSATVGGNIQGGDQATPQMIVAQSLGPEYTFVLQRLVEAQNTAMPSFRRLYANRICNGELHLLVLAKIVAPQLDEQVRAMNCHGCIIDHPSQDQHMNGGLGHLDDETQVVQAWLGRTSNASFVANAVRILGQKLGAPISDCLNKLDYRQVISTVRAEFDTFCVPCKLMVPLYLELIQELGF